MAPQKSWFTIDGQLDPIEFDGPSFFRFPMELAEFVIERFSNPDAVVLDPFCGFGTTVVAAQALGRVGIGLEHDEKHF
jgi:DNA modification methylase